MVDNSRRLFTMYLNFLQRQRSVAKRHLSHIFTSTVNFMSFFVHFSNKILISGKFRGYTNSPPRLALSWLSPPCPGFVLALPALPCPGKIAPCPDSLPRFPAPFRSLLTTHFPKLFYQ